jgi:hypothetical protein
MIRIYTSNPNDIELHVTRYGRLPPALILISSHEPVMQMRGEASRTRFGLWTAAILVIVSVSGGYLLAPRTHVVAQYGIAGVPNAAQAGLGDAPSVPADMPSSMARDLAAPPVVTPPPSLATGPTPPPQGNPFGLQ